METRRSKQGKDLVLYEHGDGGVGGIAAMDDVTSNEVPIVDINQPDHDGASEGGGAGGVGGSAASSIAQPMTGLRQSGPPPFLRKTYAMVQNPETDTLVSWSEDGTSFIIWDTHLFCRDLLPKYFKHDTLSTFIYQLNKYGFKKVSWDRWEYANEAFLAGKEHLLKNIKRKEQIPRQQGTRKPHVDRGNLTNDQAKLNAAINMLEQKLEKTENKVAKLKEDVSKQQEMVMILVNSLIPALVHRLFLKLMENGEVSVDENAKRQKLGETPENAAKFREDMENVDTTGQCVRGDKHVEQDLSGVESEKQNLGSAEKANGMVGISLPDLNSNNYAAFEKLLEDELELKNACGGEVANQPSKTGATLKELLGNRDDWGGYVTDLMEE
ncbi:hypothetical protein RJ640_017632, partial [Escallonia rubra]